MFKFVHTVLHTRLFMCFLGVFVLFAGYFSYQRLPVDAFPDVTPSLVQVFVETEGLAPEEVEKYVTYPIETSMNGLPKLKEIRSVSNFGLSVVNIYFEDGTDIYFARQLVGERLQMAKEEIPKGFGDPEMGPIATGLGQILFYFVEDESGQKTPEEMREIQDWLIKYNLQSVPGVTEVLSLGGKVKQFQVNVRPFDLLRFNISLEDVVEKIKVNNANVGAQFIVKNSEEYVVRSIGLATRIEDLKKIVLKSIDGVPVYLSSVADVEIGGEIRRGLATMNGDGEVVAGMILKLIGTNTSNVIKNVKDKLQEINQVLPSGVKAVAYYDQADLVSRCIKTVNKALRNSMILVAVIIFIFMGGIRPSIIVALSLPFSICFAFIMMKVLGISANLMSLGGIAIAIGMMVDGTIIIVENVERFLKERKAGQHYFETISKAVVEVVRPISFAIIIIIVVFLPLLTLQGVEGKTFKPLAYTVSLAMLGSLIYSLFIAPVMASFVMNKWGKEHHDPKEESAFIHKIMGYYQPSLTYFIKNRAKALWVGLGLFLTGLVVLPFLGSEFVPRLDEGDLLVRLTMAPSVSLEEAKKTVLVFEQRLLDEFPEVNRVVTRVGRGEVGAHADPVNSGEAFVDLKPVKEWKRTKSPQKLYAMMSEYFEHFPGVKFNFTQPIAAAVDELLTGTKAELAIKLFGPDMEVLKQKSSEIEAVIRTIEGASDVQTDQVEGSPQLRLTVDRSALSRYGINVGDVQNLLKTAVGGEKAGQIFEGVRRFDIYVRYDEKSRDRSDKISQILVDTPSGAKIPLQDLVKMEEVVGPRQITRENNQRFITVQCNVRGRDIGSFVSESQKALKQAVKLPAGYIIDWGGQFELQQEANKRLRLVVPVTLLIVCLLLFGHFNSFKNVGLILLVLPLAMVGGLIALKLTGQNLSVPASVGFIALFGVALQDAMVLLTTMNILKKEGESVDEASFKGACIVFRPVTMTTLTTALGLAPMLFALGTGSEVQRPLATVVVGGLLTSTCVTLFLVPAIYKWFSGKWEVEQ